MHSPEDSKYGVKMPADILKLSFVLKFRFLKKSLICVFVEQEREGVPVELLNLVDDCIEVPQHGLIREHYKIKKSLQFFHNGTLQALLI